MTDSLIKHFTLKHAVYRRICTSSYPATSQSVNSKIQSNFFFKNKKILL